MAKKKQEQEAQDQENPEAEPEKEEETTATETKEQKELRELTDTLQHLQAEFENYKKRIAKESCEFIKCANEDLILRLLPIVDNFELALKSCREKSDFYKGMELIYSQLIDTLHSQGLKHIECVGKKFDPYYHEVLLAEEGEPDNTITEELQKGYMLNDKVIRHSKVKIAKKKREEKKEEKKEEEKSPAGV